MGEEALVDGEKTLGANGLEKTVEDTAVQVTSLVVHTGHDRV